MTCDALSKQENLCTQDLKIERGVVCIKDLTLWGGEGRGCRLVVNPGGRCGLGGSWKEKGDTVRGPPQPAADGGRYQLSMAVVDDEGGQEE